MTVERKYTYSFRTVKADKLSDLISDLDVPVDVDNAFEVTEKSEDGTPVAYKRKPVTVNLELPDWVDSIPEAAGNVIRQYIADYVKANFVDCFVEVGEHDWATIERDIAESKTSGRAAAIPDAVLKLTAKSFGDFVAQQVGKAEIGKRLEAVVNGKVTQAALTKHLTECSVEVVDKVQARLDTWLNFIDESGAEDAEDFANGYQYVTSRLNKVKKALTTDIADVVRNML